MVSSGSLRRLLAPLGAALWMLTVSAGAVLADEAPTTCSVEVAPGVAPGGSVFVFSGTGFQPTQLTLRKVGGEPVVHELSVGDTDPWEVTVRSRIGDEGSWTATFSDPEVDCTAIVRFRVTLSSTDVVDDIVAATQSQSAPLLLYAVVIVLGFGGGVAIGRRINARALA
jgi:hypothetical protein